MRADLGIPNNIALAGVLFHEQALVFEAGVNPFGAVPAAVRRFLEALADEVAAAEQAVLATELRTRLAQFAARD